MKRHAGRLMPVLLFVVVNACNRDGPTGVSAVSPRVEGNTPVLRDAIAFFTRQFNTTEGGIAIMNPDGSDRRALSGGERGFEPALSPDGRRVAFTRPSPDGVGRIYIMNIDGTDPRLLVDSLMFPGQPAWSPDGCQIAFLSPHPFDNGFYALISIINADGTGRRELTPPVASNEAVFDLNPTFSPDGKRVAFVRNLTLHIINVDGTGMTDLKNEDLANTPAWSPDGQRIAYSGLGDIRVRNIDGLNPVSVTTTPEFEGYPRWSPDGRQLLFNRGTETQIQLLTINLDGTGEVNLTPDGVDDFTPDWSHRPATAARCDAGVRVEVTPSPKTLLLDETRQFLATVRTTSGGVLDNAAVVWSSTDPTVATVTGSGVVTAIARGTTTIQAQYATAIGNAVVTVGNPIVLENAIVYVTDEFGFTQLSVVRPDGNGRHQLTRISSYESPAISPDGRLIATATSFGIEIIDAFSDGSSPRTVVSRGFLRDDSPAWSPDGSMIAFRSKVDGLPGQPGRIFVVNLDGSDLHQLSPDVPDPNQVFYSDEGPTWSPDGTKIAFSRSGELMVINVDGSSLIMLPTPDGADRPSWSPDGTRIAYSSSKSSQTIHVSNADGSNPVRVTRTGDWETNPQWSPDSRRLVFCRRIDGVFQLFTINADGSSEERLSENTGAAECPADWSPVP